MNLIARVDPLRFVQSVSILILLSLCLLQGGWHVLCVNTCETQATGMCL